jgi:hypothetical protein
MAASSPQEPLLQALLVSVAVEHPVCWIIAEGKPTSRGGCLAVVLARSPLRVPPSFRLVLDFWKTLIDQWE